MVQKDDSQGDRRLALHRQGGRYAWNRFLARAGLPDLTLHDLRHVYGSTLVADGVSLKVVAELLGHQDAALTLRTYSHALPETKRDAVRRLDAIVEAG